MNILHVTKNIAQFGDGSFLVRITTTEGECLKGMPKPKQAEILAVCAGMLWFKVKVRNWVVQKSGNLIYHPNTYTLVIRTMSIDGLYPHDAIEMAMHHEILQEVLNK